MPTHIYLCFNTYSYIMKKPYTVNLEFETVEEIREREPYINFSGLVRTLLERYNEEKQK